MAKQQSKGGKGQEKDMTAGNSKNPRLKRRSTPKPAYSYEAMMSALKRKKNVGQNTLTGEIVVANGAIGNRLLGGVDYLQKAHGFQVSFVSKKAFIDLVKADQVKPFNAFKAEEE